MFATASSLVFPSLIQPGSEGTTAVKPPSSLGSRTTLSFIQSPCPKFQRPASEFTLAQNLAHYPLGVHRLVSGVSGARKLLVASGLRRARGTPLRRSGGRGAQRREFHDAIEILPHKGTLPAHPNGARSRSATPPSGAASTRGRVSRSSRLTSRTSSPAGPLCSGNCSSSTTRVPAAGHRPPGGFRPGRPSL